MNETYQIVSSYLKYVEKKQENPELDRKDWLKNFFYRALSFLCSLWEEKEAK